MKCDACDEKEAVCKLILTDLEGCVVDTFYLCEECHVVSVTIRNKKPLSMTSDIS